MSYKCEILADSISLQGNRLTTFKVTYPRIIHAEMCRHRILSRNTASSRAIPFEKMVKDVQENPFIPIAWQKDHKGMQGSEYLMDDGFIEGNWLRARDFAVRQAKELYQQYDVTKQLCNRLLEPFVWTTELVSGTEWENFFSLRCPKYYTFDENGKKLSGYRSKKDLLSISKNRIEEIYDDIQWLKVNESQAEIHIQKIAEMMWDCYNESKPKTLQVGEWHIPYGDNICTPISVEDGIITSVGIKELCKSRNYHDLQKVKIATARCARISYTTLGNNPKIDYEADIKLHDRLLESKHFSCFEHCAKAMSNEEYDKFFKGSLEYDSVGSNKELIGTSSEDGHGWANNYHGFIQYRYLIENESN